MLHPVRKATVYVCIILPVLATVAVCLRFYARRARKLPLLADDWSALVSLVTTVVACILTVYGILAHGLGLGPKELKPEHIKDAFKVFYATLLLLYFTFGVIKISFILFYQRLFPSPRFRLACNIIIAAIAGWTIAQFIIEALNSWNIPGFWNTKLLDYGAFNISMAILDLVFDVSILLLPIPVVLNLQMDKRRKYSLIAIFWLGAICIIASSLRIYYTYEFLHIGPTSSESWITYVSSSNSLWLAVEANMSVIAACLPTLGGFLKGRLEARSTNKHTYPSDQLHNSPNKNRAQVRAKVVGGSGSSGTASSGDGPWIPLRDVIVIAEGGEGDEEKGWERQRHRDGEGEGGKGRGPAEEGGKSGGGKGEILVERTYGYEREMEMEMGRAF